MILLALGSVLILSVGPVFGHHFATGLEHGLAGKDHLGLLCLIALHEIVQPVHRLFHGLILAGLAYALFDRARATLRVRSALAPLEAVEPRGGDPFWMAAAAAGVDPRRVRVVGGLPIPAFTVGWLHPRIFVAESLAQDLTAPELEALLAHEGAHVARRDPLRLSALRFLALLLFWIPALRRLADDVADEAEVQADDYAARERPLALASAILKMAGWRGADPDLESAVGFSQRRNLLDRRIRRLAGEDPPVESHVTRRSITAAFAALALVWISGAMMVHPLPEGGQTHHLAHCEHSAESPLTHLFCFREALRVKSDICPHAGLPS